MIRSFQVAAFAAGLTSIAWVGAGYVPGNPLALALVLLIAAFYIAGALELRRFQQATASLERQLQATNEAPSALGPWLDTLHPGLRHAVRLRIEGERVALPAPALTPYLAGLLVLLGMLGTFLGMVVTLKGTGLALENATDLDAIRATLAAPVKGLGLAFGTSVAGVAASAMLGLMSALARRERQRAVQLLDMHIVTTLRAFSRAHEQEAQARQREESLQLLRVQAEAMPALVGQLQGLVAQLNMQQQDLQDRLVANQAQFHGEAQRAYAGLAESVDRSLQSSLAESARLAGAAIEPAVQATMAGLARETAALREVLAGAVQAQLDGVSSRLEHTTSKVLDGVATRVDRHAGLWTEAWREALGQQRQDHAALLRSVGEAHAAWEATSSTALAERQQQICSTLQATAQTITAQAEAHAQATIAEIGRLVQAASEAPRAAAEVMVELRGALSDSLVRDNAALDERNRLLATLGSLLDAVNHAGSEQRAAIDALVQATSEVLDRVGTRFAATVEAESQTLQSVAAQVTGSAAEVASLGEGFGVAVNLFGQASERLAAQLQAIEVALGQSMVRSDEQLAYYVAQAREIIDLTLGSQKQIVDDLQRIGRTPAEADAA
ncbi:MAG: hypothetical protein QM722_23950 [Piscinibacter sp.]